MRLAVWCLIFLLLLNSAFRAQNPGYLGKKTVAGYGFYINPAISAALIDYGTNVINTQHEFFLERAMTKKVTLGFSFKLYRSTYNNTGNVDMTDIYNYNTSGGYLDGLDPSGSIDIKARNYAVYFKFSRYGYVAPWGKYVLLGLTYNTRVCSYDPDKMFVEYTTTSYVFSQPVTQTRIYNDFGPAIQAYQYPDILFGIGNTRIFRNKFVIDYGWNINAVAFTFTIVDALDAYEPLPESYIRTNTAMRVRGINRFNVFMRLGYLF